jgi:hypothetical protein
MERGHSLTPSSFWWSRILLKSLACLNTWERKFRSSSICPIPKTLARRAGSSFMGNDLGKDLERCHKFLDHLFCPLCWIDYPQKTLEARIESNGCITNEPLLNEKAKHASNIALFGAVLRRPVASVNY